MWDCFFLNLHVDVVQRDFRKLTIVCHCGQIPYIREHFAARLEDCFPISDFVKSGSYAKYFHTEIIFFLIYLMPSTNLEFIFLQ